MIVEYTRYKIQETECEAFLHAYEQASKYMRDSPECLAYELTQCSEEKGRYILRIEWTSMEGHLQGFRKAAGFQEFFQLVKPFFQNIEEMKHYELTSVTYRGK